jgi:hypothetical protein
VAVSRRLLEARATLAVPTPTPSPRSLHLRLRLLPPLLLPPQIAKEEDFEAILKQEEDFIAKVCA